MFQYRSSMCSYRSLINIYIHYKIMNYRTLWEVVKIQLKELFLKHIFTCTDCPNTMNPYLERNEKNDKTDQPPSAPQKISPPLLSTT
jgi:hypothetical protein